MMNQQNAWGEKVIEKALAYANYQWTAHAENVLHGLDFDGIYIDTPDISWTGEKQIIPILYFAFPSVEA